MTRPATARKRAEALCSVLFSLAALAVMQGPAGTFGFERLGFPAPGLDVAVLLYRAYFMRHKPSHAGTLALGATADLYTSCPLGVHMLIYFALNVIVQRVARAHERLEYRAWPKTVFFALCAAVTGEALFLGALYGNVPDPEFVTARLVLTMAAYPMVHLLMRGFAASGGDGGPEPEETTHKPPVRALHYMPEEQINHAP